MAEFKVRLHPQQLEVYKDPARFKIVVAGRRWGKSRLALYILLVEGLKSTDADVYYIAPTFEQGKRIMWRLLKEIGRYGKPDGLIKWAHENTATCELVNGRRIHICGADRPDTLRGVSIKHAVLDEYASMKPLVWEEIIEPALMDAKGGATFIGTPAGKNHFYDLFLKKRGEEDWGVWQFSSKDNPFLDPREVAKRTASMSTQIARQELEGSFESFGAGLFKESWIKYGDEPKDGDWYVAVDLAGFEEAAKPRGKSGGKLDETAVWAVKVNTDGWYLGALEHGRWNIRETTVRILRLAQEKRALCVGIEVGALKNAVMPYLEDQMRRIGYYPRIERLTHGGKSKIDRVTWSLQGRFERGVITLKEADWNREFIEQLMDFPNPLAHDDLVDSLAYIDQLAVTPYGEAEEQDEWQPLDFASGY